VTSTGRRENEILPSSWWLLPFPHSPQRLKDEKHKRVKRFYGALLPVSSLGVSLAYHPGRSFDRKQKNPAIGPYRS
jgi:hypothetical protein